MRDRAALAGALARPINNAQYENADLALQAATSPHGIAETQPFIDGNKRAALVVMLTFLEINGSHVQASDRELADWIIAFSAGTSPHVARGMTYPFQSTIATSEGDRAWGFRYSSEGKSRSLFFSRDIRTLRALCPDRKILHQLSDDARTAVSEPTGDHPGA